MFTEPSGNGLTRAFWNFELDKYYSLGITGITYCTSNPIYFADSTIKTQGKTFLIIEMGEFCRFYHKNTRKNFSDYRNGRNEGKTE